MSQEQQRLPIVVLGGGLAGLSAACRAIDLGESVVVMEAGPGDDYLCNSRLTGGVFHLANHSTDEPADVLAEALEHGAFGETDPELGRLLIENASRAVSWLEAHGATFDVLPFRGTKLRMLSPYNRDAGLGFGPDMLLRNLGRFLSDRGGQLLLSHRVVDLVTDDRRVVGVRFRSDDGDSEMPAKAVVLADGGFQNDDELVRRHIAPDPHRIVRRNSGASAGTTLRLCEALGARTVHLDSFYGHLVSADALTNRALAFFPVLDDVTMSGVVVDRHGRRFCDEGLGGTDTANKLARRPDPYAVVICDAQAWEDSHQTEAVMPAANPQLEARGATVHTAATIGELAKLAGLPARQVEDTVAEFNRFVEATDPDAAPSGHSHHDATLPVTRTRIGMPLRGIRTPPFKAIPAAPAITFTLGGPLIDAQARVQSSDGRPIDGLYAAGGATGGFDGGENVGYAGGVLKATVTGLAAAEHIAGS